MGRKFKCDVSDNYALCALCSYLLFNMNFLLFNFYYVATTNECKITADLAIIACIHARLCKILRVLPFYLSFIFTGVKQDTTLHTCDYAMFHYNYFRTLFSQVVSAKLKSFLLLGFVIWH